MSDVWYPLDPEGSRPPEAPGREQGPDPEPIVRTVRVAFLLEAVEVEQLAEGAGRAELEQPVRRPGQPGRARVEPHGQHEPVGRQRDVG